MLEPDGADQAQLLARAREPRRVARALRRVFPVPPAAALARLRKAVCDPARLGLLRALGAGPLTVDDLALVIGRSPAATSQHLRVLRELGLVEGRRRGTAVHYRLRPGPATDDVLAAARRLAQGARDARAAARGAAGAAR
jgi:ArsR family transcriptional regulator